MISFKRVLVLAPHTDDGEIGAGGLIAKCIENEAVVRYVAYSTCEESVPAGYPDNILEIEVREATAVLGIKEENLIINDFRVRHFPEYRQQILESMIVERKRFDPDLVLMPSRYDCHQDHEVIFQEGLRAFKSVTMLGYEVLWNNIQFEANLLVDLKERHIQAKMSAFSKYQSQAGRNYGPDDLLRLAMTRGAQIKSAYAEAYNIIRWIWS